MSTSKICILRVSHLYCLHQIRSSQKTVDPGVGGGKTIRHTWVVFCNHLPFYRTIHFGWFSIASYSNGQMSFFAPGQGFLQNCDIFFQPLNTKKSALRLENAFGFTSTAFNPSTAKQPDVRTSYSEHVLSLGAFLDRERQVHNCADQRLFIRFEWTIGGR